VNCQNVKTTISVKERLVVETFEKINGNQKKLNSVLCSISRADTTTVNISSLYSRIASVYSTSKKYKEFSSKHRYNEYLSQVFTFPKSAKKQLVVKKMKMFLTQMIIYPRRNQRRSFHTMKLL
jgi:hypothetical protein